jgi:hypothetical protein
MYLQNVLQGIVRSVTIPSGTNYFAAGILFVLEEHVTYLQFATHEWNTRSDLRLHEFGVKLHLSVFKPQILPNSTFHGFGGSVSIAIIWLIWTQYDLQLLVENEVWATAIGKIEKTVSSLALPQCSVETQFYLHYPRGMTNEVISSVEKLYQPPSHAVRIPLRILEALILTFVDNYTGVIALGNDLNCDMLEVAVSCGLATVSFYQLPGDVRPFQVRCAIQPRVNRGLNRFRQFAPPEWLRIPSAVKAAENYARLHEQVQQVYKKHSKVAKEIVDHLEEAQSKFIKFILYFTLAGRLL